MIEEEVPDDGSAAKAMLPESRIAIPNPVTTPPLLVLASSPTTPHLPSCRQIIRMIKK
jgi:hypothetical protein